MNGRMHGWLDDRRRDEAMDTKSERYDGFEPPTNGAMSGATDGFRGGRGSVNGKVVGGEGWTLVVVKQCWVERSNGRSDGTER